MKNEEQNQQKKKRLTIDKYKLMSFIFLLLGLLLGAFYREFTKFMNFTGLTQLSVLHTHTLVLGFIVPFIISLDKTQRNKFLDKLFFISYNVSLAIIILCFLSKGILQVTTENLTSLSINSILAGINGVGHIVLTAAFCVFIASYFVKEKTQETK